ncbi:hypothetical protein ACFE04_003004 [Oxalis oulophora]
MNTESTKQRSPQKQQQIGTVQHLLSGGVSGAFSKTCTAPLARLTILLQVQGMHSELAAVHGMHSRYSVLSQAGLRHEAARIVHEEGFRAFWKGNWVSVVHRFPYSAVNFYTYELYKRLFHSLIDSEHSGSPSRNPCLHFLSGGLAGVTAAAVTYPLDLVRTRLSAQRKALYYKGINHAFRTICKEEGFLGLYKGLTPTLMGVAPNMAISFSVYESLKSSWNAHRPDDSTVLVGLACGSLSGIASSTATYPLDLVRRRKQMEGAGGRASVYKTGSVGMFKHILKSEGLRGLYKGILPEYYKVVPGVGIFFMGCEMMKMLMSPSPSDC